MIVSIVILTGSRNGIFSLLIYEIAILSNKNKGLFSIGLGILLLFYYSISVYDIIAILNSFGLGDFFRVDSLLDASGRTEVWEVAWQELKRSPWFGNGMMYDNYFIDEYGLQHYGVNRARHWYGIWNSYLSLLLNVGIIGLAAFAYFIKEMYRFAQNKNLAFAFLVMALFSAITESWMAASMNAFTPLFFLYWAIQAQPINRT
jgi:O-antigen ligase